MGRRVLCTDRHIWSTGRIVQAFRGQWNVEELFRRAKKGGIVPWGPSHQWADSSLRLHTFATVLGLTLVSLVRLALGTRLSVAAMMRELAAVRATLVQTAGSEAGRRPTVMLARICRRCSARRSSSSRWIGGCRHFLHLVALRAHPQQRSRLRDDSSANGAKVGLDDSEARGGANDRR